MVHRHSLWVGDVGFYNLFPMETMAKHAPVRASMGSIADLPKVHTSDLIVYRRCRRKWDLGSYMRRNLQPVSELSNLWFGSVFHAALEDFHGYRRFEHAADAFRSYASSQAQAERPVEYEEFLELGSGMLDYYEIWLQGRDQFQTLVIDGRPQVEVKFALPVMREKDSSEPLALYCGKLDRLAVDEYGRLWVVEYKTAKTFNTSKLERDFQATAYLWAATQIYGHMVEGIVYQQFFKGVPKEPKVLKNGQLSQDRRIKTTYRLYLDALKRRYGSLEAIPMGFYREYLDELAMQETPDGDPFIRRDYVRRSLRELASFEEHIRAQIQETLDPNLKLYPNPTSDCAWDCAFKNVCLAMDDGSDYSYLLDSDFRVRKLEE